MDMSFLRTEQRLGLSQSLRLYGHYLLLLVLQPAIAFPATLVLPSIVANWLYAVLAIVSAGLVVWVIVRKRASYGFWVIGCIGWFVVNVLVGFLSAAAHRIA
jgi:hypothetical protein